MAKEKLFVCSNCGTEFSKWEGKCKSCGEWNTIADKPKSLQKTFVKPAVKAQKLNLLPTENLSRINTGSKEFDITTGGGLVHGSTVLIGGEPGIGKSTLALQIINKCLSLYVSGEESPSQIRQRADRLKVATDNIYITTNTIVEEIEQLIDDVNPLIVLVDSVQTISTSQVSSQSGSVAQIRESASRLSDFCRSRNITLLLIGHITKEGNIAGPKILEHIVDTVLYFEGDFTREYRILRAFKNRYGSVNEIGLFQMTSEGLSEVADKNSIFLSPYLKQSPGNAICAAIEGSRTILFEIQSLVVTSAFANPRRMADGFDLNRFILLVAVIEKHLGLKLSATDVYLNVAGGFQINETASDLAVAVSIISSYLGKAVSSHTGFLGEISLSGDIRPVSQSERRVTEFEKNGFKRVFLSAKDASISEKVFSGKIFSVGNISEIVKNLFE